MPRRQILRSRGGSRVHFHSFPFIWIYSIITVHMRKKYLWQGKYRLGIPLKCAASAVNLLPFRLLQCRSWTPEF